MSNLQVRYGDISLTKNTKQLAKNEVQEKPTLSFQGEPNTFYTLIMVDPQANPEAAKNTHPTKEGFHSFLHWMIMNIPSLFDTSLATELQAYYPPTPPSPKNRPNLQPVHYYHFLVYKQPHPIMNPSGPILKDGHFIDLSQFIKDNHLEFTTELKMAVAHSANSSRNNKRLS